MTPNIQAFLDEPGIVVDVRTPSEFVQGHIPGSINIPLFTDNERSIVGTLYKQEGHEEAVQRGLEIVGPKMASLALEAKKQIGKNLAKVYCWRGGMRSRSMAWLFQATGLKTLTLQNGYKAFRRCALQALARPLPLVLIGGLTGCGKTTLLRHLKSEGGQVIDLEALAQHRGSSYGFMDGQLQPSNEQFENLIAWQCLSLDLKRPVWVEDESRMIGKCKIPDPFFTQMRMATLLIVKTSRQERIRQLLQDYGTVPISSLVEATQRIAKKLGGARTRQVIEYIREQNLGSAIEILLDYYDKAYTESLKQRYQPIFHLPNHPCAAEGWGQIFAQ